MFAENTRFRSLWTPKQLPTSLWLDAADKSTISLSGSAVTEWRDKSGSNRHIYQSIAGNRPTLQPSSSNGLDTLYFDGDDFLQSNASITTGTYTGSRVYFWVAFFPSGSNGGVILTERSTGRVSCTQWVYVNPNWYISSDGLDIQTNHTISSNTFNALIGQPGLVCHIQTPGILDTLYLNGNQVALTSPSVRSNNVNGGTAYFRVGGREGNVGGMVLGNLCEVVALMNNVPEPSRIRMEGYLAHKWGLKSRLPINHPYKNYPPRGI